MTTVNNTGKSLNELRTQGAVFQTQILAQGESVDLTSIDSSYIAWVHPISSTATITYYGEQVFKDPKLIAANIGEDILVGSPASHDISGPFPINLKTSSLTSTTGSVKVSFGRL